MSSVTTQSSDSKTFAIIAYVLFLIPVPILTLIGVVLCYVKRSESAGTMYFSHYSAMIGFFWKTVLISVGAFILTLMLAVTGIGAILIPLVYVGVLVWVVYYYVKLIQGVVRVTSAREFNGAPAIG